MQRSAIRQQVSTYLTCSFPARAFRGRGVTDDRADQLAHGRALFSGLLVRVVLLPVLPEREQAGQNHHGQTPRDQYVPDVPRDAPGHLGHGSAPEVAGEGPGDSEEEGSGGSGGGDPTAPPVAGPESQSLRKPGPSMVAALMSISGHGPAVSTVQVPHTAPMTRKNRSRRNGGSSLRVTHRSYLPGIDSSILILPSVVTAPIVRTSQPSLHLQAATAVIPGQTRARHVPRGADRGPRLRVSIGSTTMPACQSRSIADP